MGKELEVTLKVKVRTCFDDNESDEQTVRYLLEQDLEDAGWDCDVEVVNWYKIRFLLENWGE